VSTSVRAPPALDAFDRATRDRLSGVLLGVEFDGRISDEAVRAIRSAGVAMPALLRGLLPVAQSFAHADFEVGAVAEGASGALYLGANLEVVQASLALTLHAEQSAVLGAVAHGERGLRRLAVTSTPCGVCRQFLAEVVDASALEIHIHGDVVSLRDLLPRAFGPSEMSVDAALLAHGEVRTALSLEGDRIHAAALASLRRSYAPYTHSPSGVALRSASGTVAAGPYVENAAYNPSVTPVIAALDRLRFAQRDDARVVEAVLVESQSRRVEQGPLSRLVLAAVAPRASLTAVEVRLA